MAARLFFLTPDAAILDLIRNGDEEGLVMLYAANERMVRAFVTNNSGTPDDAEDLLQEAVIILWERMRAGTFEPNAKLSTFIYATVRNLWRARLRGMKREMPSDLAGRDDASDEPSPADALAGSDMAAAVAAALDRLGEPCRTLLLLYYWEERSMEEIAAQLKFANADTAKSKKYQCKKALERILTDERII